MDKKISTGLGVAILILVAVIVVGVFYFFGQKGDFFSAPIDSIKTVENIPQVCTEEAKICPDGSAVGRTGENCEFAPCPEKNSAEPILGGDRDEHGCIGSAGYSWCEVKQKCLRVWEEKCEK
jgi:hypothetical protein